MAAGFEAQGPPPERDRRVGQHHEGRHAQEDETGGGRGAQGRREESEGYGENDPGHDAHIEAHGGEGKLDGRATGRCAQASPQLLTRSGTILNMTRLAGMARPPHRPARLGYFS